MVKEKYWLSFTQVKIGKMFFAIIETTHLLVIKNLINKNLLKYINKVFALCSYPPMENMDHCTSLSVKGIN